MTTVKVQAREIVRAAKRNAIKMQHGSYDECAVGVLGLMVGYSFDDYQVFHPLPEHNSEEKFYRIIARKAGRTYEDIRALEAGFEENQPYRDQHKGNRYFKVGERVAALAGV